MESNETVKEDLIAGTDRLDSEAKYRRLHESMTDAFVSTDMEGRITEVNRAFEVLVGYCAEDLLRMTYIDLTPEKWHAFEQGIVEAEILPRGHSEVYNKEYRRRDGSIIPVELRTFLLRDPDGQPAGMWAIVRDITERIRLERALQDSNALLEKRVEDRTADLRDSESRFRMLAEASFEAISVTENGRIVDINTRYSEMLGWEQHELVGRPVIDLLAPDFHELATRHMRDGYEQAYEVEMRRKNGEIFPCEARGKMTDWQGRRLRVTVIRDLTETKRVEAQLAEQKAALARFQRMALLSEISAGVVHQISQPISAIVNNVAAARAMAATCDRPNCADLVALLDIGVEFERLRDTIDRLRALAHPERQNRTPQCLAPILQDAMREVETDALNQGVTISLDCPADLPRVMADAIQLGQAFLNLLHNAIEAVASRPQEQGQVTASARRLPGDEVEITIRDSGSGISPEAQSRLFEPLYTTKDQGNGIGLALCRTIITAHRGRISGANNMDQPGANFQVILPAIAEAP